MKEGLRLLQNTYDLHTSPEVQKAAQRTERRTGERVPQEPDAQIQNYLDRFSEIIARDDPDAKARGVSALKKLLHQQYVIDHVPEAYLRLQRRIAREAGQGAELPEEYSEEQIADYLEVIQKDQQQSLDKWIDYLASEDALYPDWAKYWVLRSVLAMSTYDKEKHEFGMRSNATVAPFPEINREAITHVVDYISALRSKELRQVDEKIRQQKNQIKKARSALRQDPENVHIPDGLERAEAELRKLQEARESLVPSNPVEATENPFTEEEKRVSDEEFAHLLSTENFAKYYAFAIEHVVADNSELFKNTEGEWRVFKQGSDAQTLTSAIQGHGTGWCTAGETTATTQLERGDFHVYFSNNELGEAKIPRLAIRMNGDQIAEIRGVAKEQEVDPYIVPVLEQKMDEFGAPADKYKKQAEDMKRLTAIDRRYQAGEELTREALRFLYEIDSSIEGFGYDTDPRIREILISRDWLEDMRTIFGTHDDSELINRMIEAGQKHRVAERITQFSDLDQQDAESLIRAGVSSAVPRHLDHFHGLDHPDIARKVIEAGDSFAVVTSLDKFVGIDHRDIAHYMIEHGGAHEVARYLDVFRGLDHRDIADRIIRSGRGQAVAEHLDKFSGIDHQTIAHQIIDANRGQTVAEYIHEFHGLDHRDIADRIIEAGQGAAVAMYIDGFTGLDHPDIVRRIIAGGGGLAVAENLDHFRGLDHREVAQQLIDAGLADVVAEQLWHFRGLDHSDVAQQLIAAEKISALSDHLNHFYGLNQEVAESLDRAGYGSSVAKHLDSFANLSQEFVDALPEVT